jgi:hypothetical protein
MKMRENMNEEVKEQKKTTISVRTKVNGYLLEVNDEGYMFFDIRKLLEGMFIHVGMERLEAMTKEEIDIMMAATKDGSLVRQLQAEVTALKAERAEQKKLIRDQKREIKELKRELKMED